MELANLILEYIKALVWPVLAAVVLWRFRSPLQRLVERIASESHEVEGFGFKTKLRGASAEEQALNVQKEVTQIETGGVEPGPVATHELTRAPTHPRERYLLAEELVMRSLEVRWGDAIARHRVVELPNGRRVEFDGVLDGPRQVIVVEVKLLARPAIPSEVFVNTSENLIALRQHVGKAVIGLVALVALEESDEYRRLESTIHEKTASAPTPMIAEFFYLPALIKEFLGVDENAR